jgi:hypothetical protein
MRPEGLSHRKIPVTPSGTEPATFRLVDTAVEIALRLVVQDMVQLRSRVSLYVIHVTGMLYSKMSMFLQHVLSCVPIN